MDEQNSSTLGDGAPKSFGFWRETGRFFVLVFGSALIIRLFVATPFIVSGASMYPTFKDKEYLVVDKVAYKLDEPSRGDVIVFQYPLDPSKFFIKRVIGLPGEHVSIRDGVVTIKKINGDNIVLTEPYIREPFHANFDMSLDSTHYFVMGDNRNESSDSRQWGALPANLITGRADLRLFPLNRISVLPGEAKP